MQMDLIPDRDMDGLDTIKEGYIPLRVDGESWGKISMKPHRDVVAGSFMSTQFDYVVSVKGLAIGGGLRIGTPCTGWEKPRLPYSRYWYANQPASFIKSNTSVELLTSRGAILHPYVEARMLRYAPPGGMWRWWISAQVEEAPLEEGDRIRVSYGDKKLKEGGIQAQKFLERGAYFIALVDIDGDGVYGEIPHSPFKFDVIKGQAKQFHITLPSIIQKEGSCEMRVALMDDYWNPVTQPGTEPIPLDLENPAAGLESNDTFSGSQFSLELSKEHFPHTGKVELLVKGLGSLKGRSNPVWVQTEVVEEQIFWGDLHAQSQYHGPGASSVGTPDELYDYAREITHLDFVAITDDVAPLSNGWRELQQAAIDHYEPGAFVPLKAFEWCSKRYGHRNTIYADVEIEDNYPRQLFEGTIEAFWEFFQEKDVLIIPHHTFLWTDWNFHNPALEPLVEIHSCWGTSERPGNPNWDHSIKPGGGVQAALGRGYRLGIIASSDTCAGMPGRSVPNAERWHFHKEKGGIVAVFAPELTRAAIVDALRRRRTYGTTGARIVLDFSLNGHPMGSEYVWSGDTPIELTIKAGGTDLIRSLTVVRNNVDIRTFDVRDDIVEISYQEQHNLTSIAFQDDCGQSVVFYYIRLTQYDGEMAWSSPIWVRLDR